MMSLLHNMVSTISQDNVIDEFPEEYREFISDIVNVLDDGNCGYRVVASGMGMKDPFAW